MRLLFLMPNWDAYSEIWLHRMIQMLEDKIVLLGTNFPQSSKWEGKIGTFQINIPPTPVSRVLERLSSSSKREKNVQQRINQNILKHIRIKRIDRILVHYAEFALRFKNVFNTTGIPIFVHCHGYDVIWDLQKEDGTPYYGPEYKEAILGMARLPNIFFIVNSTYTENRLLEIGIDKNKIFKKHFGVPIPKDFQWNGLAKRLNLLFIGRLVDFKGPDKIIESFLKASHDGLDADLYIAGDGPLKSLCQHKAMDSILSDRIHFPGQVDLSKGNQLRREADLFITHNYKPSSNQEEAFGVSIVEAMAYGLPIISTISGAIPENVEHNRNGLLSKPLDVQQQARNLLLLGKDKELRRQFGDESRNIVREKFSLERERDLLLKILEIH